MSKILDRVKEINDKWAEQEPDHAQFPRHKGGSIHQRARLREVAELALQTYQGDILEIGCHIGLTTKIFAELAQEHGRKVVVVDPWDGRQEGNQNVYEQFVNNTSDFKEIIEVNRMGSQEPEAVELIKAGTFAFCWIDGLHTPFACKSDIKACLGQVGLQAVDDLSWSSGGALKELFYVMADKHGYEQHYDPRCREGYYVTGPPPLGWPNEEE